MSVLMAVKELVVMFAALAGAIVASMGLRVWRQQLKGRTEYDVARRLLRSVFRLRDAVRAVRNPIVSPAEMRQAMKEAGLSDGEIKEKYLQIESSQAVYNARWKGIAEALSDLKVEAAEAEVLWGTTVQERLKPVYKVVGSLRQALTRYLRHEAGGRPVLDDEKMDEIDDVVSETSEDPKEDCFTNEMCKAIAAVEEYIRPKLYAQIH